MPRCASCQMIMTESEAQLGSCPVCGASHAGGFSAAPPGMGGYPAWQSPPSTDEAQLRRRKMLVVSLLVLTLASLCVPYGTIWSIFKGFQKTHSICACDGCLEPTAKVIEFGNLKEKTLIGFCKLHADSAPKTVGSSTRGKSLSNLLTFFMVLAPLVLIGFCIGTMSDAIHGAKNGMKFFVWMCLAVIVPLNVLSYFYWIYLEWILRVNQV